MVVPDVTLKMFSNQDAGVERGMRQKEDFRKNVESQLLSQNTVNGKSWKLVEIYFLILMF